MNSIVRRTRTAVVMSLASMRLGDPVWSMSVMCPRQRIGRSMAEAHDFWVVPELPAPLQESANPPPGWTPVNRAPSGGVVGRRITWPPGFQYPMHTTPTLDFIVILSGQLELGLEKGTQLLGPGDVLVQQGTAHRWRNPGPASCTFVAVMIDAARV
jgi:quercetin dioxygenase-like cupin family protein